MSYPKTGRKVAWLYGLLMKLATAMLMSFWMSQRLPRKHHARLQELYNKRKVHAL
jgi:hypothetical protein